MNYKQIYLTIACLCSTLALSLSAAAAPVHHAPLFVVHPAPAAVAAPAPAAPVAVPALAAPAVAHAHAPLFAMPAAALAAHTAAAERIIKTACLAGAFLICIGGVMYLFVHDEHCGAKLIICGLAAILAYQQAFAH